MDSTTSTIILRPDATSMYASPLNASAAIRARRAGGAGRVGRASGSPVVRPGATGGSPAKQQQQQQQQLLPGAVLLQDGVTTVSVNSALPAEVRQELAHFDPYADPFSGHIDLSINYAFLVTRKKLLIWNHLARGALPSTCFRLALTPPGSKSEALPLVSLAPNASGREPGAVIVSQNGTISYIESIAASEGVQDAQQVGLVLVPNETVTVLKRYGIYTFAVATSHSRLFRLTISVQDGRRVAQVAPFLHSKGLLGRLFGSSSTYGLSSEPILSLALGEAPGVKLLYALSPSSIQRWHLVEGGVDVLAVEQDVRSLIVTAVQQAHSSASADNGSGSTSSAISLIDCAVTVGGALAVLYVERSGSGAASSSAIAVLNFNATSSSLSVTSISELKGIFESDSRAEYRPQLVIPNGGSAAFVIQPSSLTARLLTSDFEFHVVLKNQSKSRIFGVGFETAAVAANTLSAGIALITTSTPPLLAHVSVTAAEELDASLRNADNRRTAETAALISFVRQAVLYGQQPLNPLAFLLPASHEGDLSIAVESLSDEFLVSENSDVAAVMDVRSHLASKKDRLAALLAFIRQSGQLGNLPASTRRKLCSDAELVDAAAACYTAHDAGLKSRSYAHLLGQAIEAVFRDRQIALQEDAVRAFFRQHIILLPEVFAHLAEAVRQISDARVQERSSILPEINQLVLAAYIAGTRRRELSGKSYGLNAEPIPYEGWSFRVTSLDLLELLYHTTERLIGDRTRDLGSTVDADQRAAASAELEESRRLQRELKTHLGDLADYTLRTFEDRLLYSDAVGPSLDVDADNGRLDRRYKLARPRLILPLVRIGRQDMAFQLAERHADYQTLTKLCQEATEGALKERAAGYVRKYGEEFAFELYQWHVEHDRIKDLLLLGESKEQGKLVQAYLEKTGNTRIAWLQHLQVQEFWASSGALLQTVKTEPDLRSRKLMLSLNKLAYAAKLEQDAIELPEAQASIKTISEGMEVVATQVRLLTKLKAYLVVETDRDVNGAVKEITEQAAGRLVDYPAFATVFAQACQKLWNHQVVTSEELIDLFTLRDCADDEVNAYVSALEVYIRATDDPVARRADYLRAIWRRIILRDDWALLADTEGVDDETLHANLRRTALYYVMKTIKGRAGYELATVEPQELAEAPSLDSLRGRFENVPEQRLRDLQADYGTEIGRVGEILQGYEPWLQQVYRLVIQDEDLEREAEEELDGGVSGASLLSADADDLQPEDDVLGEENFDEEEAADVAVDALTESSGNADIVMDD